MAAAKTVCEKNSWWAQALLRPRFEEAFHLIAEVRELPAKVHQRCHNHNVIPANRLLLHPPLLLPKHGLLKDPSTLVCAELGSWVRVDECEWRPAALAFAHHHLIWTGYSLA